MKKLLLLTCLLLPAWLGAQTLTVSAANQRKIENTLVGENIKIINALSVSSVTDTIKLTISPLRIYNKVEIQIDWSALTGTLNGQIIIQQRGNTDMQWTCLQPTETDPGNLVKTLSTASGQYTFTLWAWCGNDMRILFVKNSCTGGIINASLGLRR